MDSLFPANDQNKRPANLNDALDFSRMIKLGEFDHVDFGCSKGDSLELSKRLFGGVRGLGIDCSQAKVDMTRAAGFSAIKFNIHEIPDEKLVRFAVLSHFLEHVRDTIEVKAFVRKACILSKQFVYIQQPFFDADGYLARRGLKLFWSDWRGHPNRMTTLELWVLLRDLREEGVPISFSIHCRGLISDSSDRHIHALFSPIDQHEYITGTHPDKGEKVSFDDNVFAETVCLITMPGVDHVAMLRRLRFDRTIIDHAGQVPVTQTTGNGQATTTSRLKFKILDLINRR